MNFETFDQQAYWAETNKMNALQLAEFLCEHFGESVGKAWLLNSLTQPRSLDLLIPTSISSQFIYSDSPEGFEFWSDIHDIIDEGAAKYESNLKTKEK